MDESLVFFIIATLLFVVGLSILFSVYGLGLSIKYSHIYSNLTTTVVTRNGSEQTITIPREAVTGLRYAEKLDITYSNAERTDSTTWKITIEIRNKGKIDATIDKVLINNKDFTPSVSPTIPYTIRAGDTAVLTLTITEKEGFKPGQNLQILVHTSSGGMYPTQVVLP